MVRYFLVAFIVALLTGCSNNDNTVRIVFERVDGLNGGSEVKENGVAIGKVYNMELDKQGKVVVACKIDRKVMLGKDARFILRPIDMLGTKAIEVIAGTDHEKAPEEFLYHGEPDTSSFKEKDDAAGNGIVIYNDKQDSILQKVNELNDKVDKLLKSK